MNALGRVEAESVEMKFRNPVPSIGDEEFADGRGVPAIEIDRVAPFVRAFAVDVVVRKNAEVIAVRVEVVVDDIEDYREAERMRAVDKKPQVVRRTVKPARPKKVYSVVAPPKFPGKIGDRHHLEQGDAVVLQQLQFLSGSAPRPFGRESADMHFGHDMSGKSCPFPPIVGPFE